MTLPFALGHPLCVVYNFCCARNTKRMTKDKRSVMRAVLPLVEVAMLVSSRASDVLLTDNDIFGAVPVIVAVTASTSCFAVSSRDIVFNNVGMLKSLLTDATGDCTNETPGHTFEALCFY